MTIMTAASMRLKLKKIKPDKYAWICLCGNTPMEEGFYPCDKAGRRLEPADTAQPDDYRACDRCGRIIEPLTEEVVGVRPLHTLVEEERIAIAAGQERVRAARSSAENARRPDGRLAISEDACLEISNELEGCLAYVERDLDIGAYYKNLWTKNLRKWVGWLRRAVWENRQAREQAG
jgi:hypothetical protein